MREIAGRRGKAMSDKPLRHASGKSDDCVMCAEQRVAQEG